MPLITRLSTNSDHFRTTLRALLQFDASQDESIENAVAGILRQVRERGDEAVLEYTRRFDRMHVDSMAALEIAPSEWSAALESLPVELRTALEVSVARVKTYPEHQLAQTWPYPEADGPVLGPKTPAPEIGRAPSRERGGE